MAAQPTMSADPTLRKRLLSDIAELQTKPYPNIRLHIKDSDLTRACLVLTPPRSRAIHLRVSFPRNYPLRPPTVEIDTQIVHPNVFGTYICASILNTAKGYTNEAYTPAYTLKGIAIQLLSIFSSESIEQDTGGKISLDSYQASQAGGYRFGYLSKQDDFQCQSCRYGLPPSRRAGKRDKLSSPGSSAPLSDPSSGTCSIDTLPDELLLQVMDDLDIEGLTRLASAWGRVGELITRFDVVRVRELQCFVLKENFYKQNLGVGVSIIQRFRQGTLDRPFDLESEFDLLSETAFTQHQVRRSVHRMPFTRWLPLPISYGHWRRVKADVDGALVQIATDAGITGSDNVLYALMNDLIVKFVYENIITRWAYRNGSYGKQTSGALRHASEKAIESYFHLFHLLLCLAVERPAIVVRANRMIADFLRGRTTKKDVPNLGYLLTALLISDHTPTETLMKKIVAEAITRNVVWLLDSKGDHSPELGYLETDPVSQYRLKKTFDGSRTSYRMLMFSELFRRTARPSPKTPAPSSTTNPTTSPTKVPLPTTPTTTPSPSPTKIPSPTYSAAATSTPPPLSAPPSKKPPLPTLLADLFARHGGPPPGAAAEMASEVRRLQQIADFPSFLREMGITMPSASAFTQVLRDTVKASATAGYSRDTEAMAVPLAALRLRRDPTVTRERVAEELKGRGLVLPDEEKVKTIVSLGAIEAGRVSFFPRRSRR